jgi:hypothetical protein
MQKHLGFAFAGQQMTAFARSSATDGEVLCGSGVERTAHSEGERAATASVPSFRVFILGARGSGKTVFLSALYGQFRKQTDQSLFSLELRPSREQKFLQDMYEKIGRVDLPWLTGTPDVKKFEFHCAHRRDDRTFDLFRIDYLDYPGGNVTGDEYQLTDTLDVEYETAQADSILVLIDGRKLFERMEGYESLDGPLDSDLNAIFDHLKRSARKPVHFVVTKWDILHTLFTLEDVRRTLLAHPRFSEFVEQRRDTPLRLVPVSALGKRFARFDLELREMVKLKNGVRSPLNVDLSVALTLLDYVASSARKSLVRPSLLLKLVKVLSGGIRLSKTFVTLCPMEIPLSSLGIPLPITIRPLRVLLLLKAADTRLDYHRRHIEQTLQKATDERTAFQAILELQAWRIGKFIRQNPDTNLTEVAETWLTNTGRS